MQSEADPAIPAGEALDLEGPEGPTDREQRHWEPIAGVQPYESVGEELHDEREVQGLQLHLPQLSS